MPWIKEITATKAVIENQLNIIFYNDSGVLKAEIRIDSNDGTSETVIIDIDNDSSLSSQEKTDIETVLSNLKEEAMSRLGYTQQ
jgi:hypothetical protein